MAEGILHKVPTNHDWTWQIRVARSRGTGVLRVEIRPFGAGPRPSAALVWTLGSKSKCICTEKLGIALLET
jgi:hypothetical protein